MSDISKIVLGSTTYNIKDTVARAAMTGGMHFLGVSLSEITDGTQNVAIIVTNANTKTANRYYTGTSAPTGTTGTYSGTIYTLTNVALTAGDVVIYDRLEFVFSTSDNKWHELGSTGSLGKLAYKDDVSVTYKKATGGTFTGTKATITSVCTGTDKKVSVSASGSTSGVAVSSHSYTPAGTISGTVTNGEPGTTSVVRSVDTSKLKTTSLRGVSGTADVLSGLTGTTTFVTSAINATISGETLTLSTALTGTVTAATKAVATANATETTVATGSVASNGTGATIATGVPSDGYADAITSLGTSSFSGSFTGTTATIAHTVTQGSVSVTGTTGAIEVTGTYTPAGSVSITKYTDTTVTGS